jgi:hypothetical protein
MVGGHAIPVSTNGAVFAVPVSGGAQIKGCSPLKTGKSAALR